MDRELQQRKVEAAFFTMIFALLLLTPILTRKVSTLEDAAYSPKVSVSVSPTRIQEGDNKTITIDIRQAASGETYTLGINVTNPAGESFAKNATILTDAAGFGGKTIEYWKEFAEGANTNYVGTYVVAVMNVTTNETLATTNFTVGLTHQLKHRRNQTVRIKGSGYEANETVTLNIKLDGVAVSGYPKNLNASDKGIVSDAWKIPEDTTPGFYTVTIMNATTPGTSKAPPDSQDFYVEVWACQIRGLNLANESVAGLVVEANNKTTVPERFLGLSQPTNGTGWASFLLARGNYTFKAFWKQVEVGVFPVNITEAFSIEDDTVLRQEPWVQLSNLEVTVIEGATGKALPFIKLVLEYNNTIETGETNITGTAFIRNLFTNVSYTVVAERYGHSLPPFTVEISPKPLNEHTVEFPTFTLFVHVEDSKRNPAIGVRVEAHEWSSGLAQDKTTDSDGNATFSLTFGRYKVRTFNGTFLLNETLVDLTRDRSSLLIYLPLYNIDFTVEVIDYFGQPIPNALVKIERKTDTGYEETAPPSFTGPDGHAAFSGVLGGDSRISISVGGELGGTKELYLTNSKRVTFNLSRYVVVAGYAVETGQFVTAAALAILIVAFVVGLTYKRLLGIFLKSKTPNVKKSL